MAEDNKELAELRAENAKLQTTINNLQLQLKQEQDKNKELQEKAIVIEGTTGVFQFDGVYKSKAGSFVFAPGRKKFIYKGAEYAVEDAIKNTSLMDELIEKGYSGLIKKEKK